MKRFFKSAGFLFLVMIFLPAFLLNTEKARAEDITVLAVGETKQLNYSYSGGYDYVWMTNDTDVIRINGSGTTCQVTGLKTGSATVKVQVMYNVTRFYWISPTKGEYVTTPQYAQHSFLVRVTKDGTLITKPEGSKGEKIEMSSLDKVDKLSEGLIMVSKDDLYGFVDRNFNLVIPFQYSSAKAFNGGLASVMKDDIQYIIDPSGKTVFSGRGHARIYNNGDGTITVRDYINDRVEYKNGLYDASGKRILNTRYDYINTMSEGLRYVSINGGTRGFVDKTGEFVFTLNKDSFASDFSEGLSSADGTNEDGVWQKFFLDTSGNIAFTYSDKWNGSSFSEGLCLMRNEDELVGYLDRQGNVAIPFEYVLFDHSGKSMTTHSSTDFKDGMAVVIKQLPGTGEPVCRYGVIDTAGKELIPFDYTDIWYLGEGLFAYQKETDGFYGLINKDGKIISKCVYENNYGTFSEGVVMMCRDGKWGGIDKNGKQVIPFEYSRLDAFSDGFALSVKNGRWSCLPNPLAEAADIMSKIR